MPNYVSEPVRSWGLALPASEDGHDFRKFMNHLATTLEKHPKRLVRTIRIGEEFEDGDFVIIATVALAPVGTTDPADSLTDPS